jgi:hypothetical protein
VLNAPFGRDSNSTNTSYKGALSIIINFLKKYLNRTQVDELNKFKTAKRPKFDTIIIGEGITEFDKIKCKKCGKISTSFVNKYSDEYTAFIPSCRFCKANIMSDTFIPLDKTNKKIHPINKK